MSCFVAVAVTRAVVYKIWLLESIFLEISFIDKNGTVITSQLTDFQLTFDHILYFYILFIRGNL